MDFFSKSDQISNFSYMSLSQLLSDIDTKWTMAGIIERKSTQSPHELPSLSTVTS